jgi:hypothetical protein
MYRKPVGYKRVKTEHAGAKNGGGAWMTRAEAKESETRKRRQADEEVVEGKRSLDGWSDLDRFSAHSSHGVLRHMTEDEEAAGLSWEKLRSSWCTATIDFVGEELTFGFPQGRSRSSS